MAGRPRAPTNIVDPNTVVRINNRNEIYNMASLLPQISTTQECIRWLAERRLINNAFTCGTCQQPCRLVSDVERIDEKIWKCRDCNFKKSIRHGSFFSGSHLSLKQIILLVYCWSHDMPQTLMKHEAEIESDSTAVDWCNFMREECEVWINNNPDSIGGIDANGQPIIVEIDESKFFHRKYHRGQWREGHWVFGGVERNTGRCFLLEVPDRTARTLGPLIEQYILPGSHIMSDSFSETSLKMMTSFGVYCVLLLTIMGFEL